METVIRGMNFHSKVGGPIAAIAPRSTIGIYFSMANTRTALVTGAAGFIGSHLVEALLRGGWHVTGVDNFDCFYAEELKRRNIEDHLSDPDYRFVEADLRHGLDHIEGSFDAVVHLAARPGVAPSVQNPAEYSDINVGGTQKVLDFARERGIPQFVFASSSSIYGLNPRTPWTEAEFPAPESPYAATKAASELMGRVYSRLFGVRFIALRLFSAYGPRQRPDLAIHKFALAMVNGVRIPIYGDLDSERDYTFVGDLVSGIQSAMDYSGGPFEIVNLGGGSPRSLGDVVRGLEEILGVKAKLEFRSRPRGDVPRTSADITKAREILGYKPKTNFKSGLRAFADWFDAARAKTSVS